MTKKKTVGKTDKDIASFYDTFHLGDCREDGYLGAWDKFGLEFIKRYVKKNTKILEVGITEEYLRN